MNDISSYNKRVTDVVEDDSMTRWPNEPTGSDALASAEKRRLKELEKLHNAIIMMVDDEPINLEVTQVYLEDAGFSRFVSTDNPTKVLSLLRTEGPDVLLLDLMMPGMSGFDILNEMQKKNILQDVPTIVLTSSQDPGSKLRALELGATDFLSKPVDPSELALRMRNTLAAKAYRDRLANHDPLTGLPNRRTFLDRLDWSLHHAKQYNKSGAVLLIDLDGFKQFNDALGPGMGDQVLKIIAERLTACIRDIDELGRIESDEPHPSLSRLAGDEFAVLLSVLAKTHTAAGVAQRLLDAIESPIKVANHELRVTCGIGIATFPGDGLDADSIVKHAGVAMHHSKREKRHSYHFYSSELNASALHRLNLSNRLRNAIENGELRMFYQPTNDVKTGAVTGCEALIRWQHPEHGLIMPTDFIPLAEETGLIIPIGEWVLRTVCMQSKTWQASGLRSHRISVNVSSLQLRHTHLAKTLRKILADTGADPSFLVMELTEGVLMENAEANIEILREIRAMGVKLSIDDFGTGYSSLSYLNSFPLDELKIDRSFVMEIKEEGDQSTLIATIIAMAHGLGLTVVAEGVETPSQLGFLRSQGCDEFQGFIVSKAVPPKQYAARFLSACDKRS